MEMTHSMNKTVEIYIEISCYAIRNYHNALLCYVTVMNDRRKIKIQSFLQNNYKFKFKLPEDVKMLFAFLDFGL